MVVGQQIHRSPKAGWAVALSGGVSSAQLQGGKRCIMKEEEERTALPSRQELDARSLLVLYGTETGHSKEIAEEIVEAAERLRFRTSIEQMNDVSLVSHPYTHRCLQASKMLPSLMILTKVIHGRKKWSSTPSQSLLLLQQVRVTYLPMQACSGRAS